MIEVGRITLEKSTDGMAFRYTAEYLTRNNEVIVQVRQFYANNNYYYIIGSS